MECAYSRCCLIIIFAITILNSKAYTISDSSLKVVCNSSNEGEIQLVDGRDVHEGRVEVCHGEQWKTVCDNDWGTEEAQVVCRQLGYYASKAIHVRRGCAGQGSGEILQKKWLCNGEETKLLDCMMMENEACNTHRRDAGVYCSDQTEDNCDLRSLRLVDGPNNASGRVEVCRFGCWGTVCDEGWDRYDASVACRQLGFETDRAIPTWGAYFGEGRADRPIFISQVECERTKHVPQLLNCTRNTSGVDHQCQHSQDAGVICHGTSMCSDGDVRLVGGKTKREGIVETCYNGVWGAVCADGWNDIAANITCSQLEYTNASVSLEDYEWEIFKAPTLFNNITCNETHSMLLQCIDMHNIGVLDCGVNNTAGVICEMPTASTDDMNWMTSVLPTTLKTTDPVSSTVPKPPSVVVLNAVGGLLAAAVITVISVASLIIVLVMIKKQKKMPFKKEIVTGSAMDNPAYDECQGTSTLNNLTINHDSEHEREFENPIYSEDDIDTGLNPASKKTNSQLQDTPHYEGIYFESAEVTEAIYESTDNGIVQGAHLKINGPINNTSSANDGVIMKGATSEGVYELPPNLDGVAAGDENCYSPLDPTYSQLEPHLGVPKPGVEIPCPLNDNDYSHLKYK